METLARSWKLTKLTFSIINQDKELLAFAFLSFVFSALLTAAFVIPAVIPLISEPGWSDQTVTTVQIVSVFLIYFALAFVATFFNVCVVYTTKVRLEGGNATFGQSLAFAVTRLPAIAAWSLVAATVGLLLRALQEAGQKAGKFGSFLTSLLVGVLGAAWSVITLFVVPILVYENTGPFAAIGRSVQVIKRTWGESLAKGIGLGLVQFLIQALIVVLTVAVAVLVSEPGGTVALVLAVGVGVVLLLLSALVFSVANTVFNTALYAYAQTGKIGGGYDTADLDAAVKKV